MTKFKSKLPSVTNLIEDIENELSEYQPETEDEIKEILKGLKYLEKLVKEELSNV